MRGDGFTLIELMIGVVIITALLVLAMPIYTEFMANTKVRNVTESYANGVRNAQLEAVKRNENVKFVVTAEGWEVRDIDTDSVLKSEVVFERALPNAPTVTIEPAGSAEITFTGLGRVLTTIPPAPPLPISKIKVEPTGVGTRALGVAIAATGSSVKVCDPDTKFTYSGSTDPVACPSPW